MDCEYRQLSAGDITLFRDLLRVFGEAFLEPDTYLGAQPDDPYLAALLSKPHFVALAAIADGRVAGGLAAYELEKFERARSEMYIYDLAVFEPFRRQGIATGLIRALQQIARGRGVYVIFVQADHGDEPAIRLYESLGTKEEVLHFDIRVG